MTTRATSLGSIVLVYGLLVTACAPTLGAGAERQVRAVVEPGAEKLPAAVPPSAATSSWRSFVGDGFTVHFPSSFEAVDASRSSVVHARSYIPTCRDGFLACVLYVGPDLAATNFDSAGIGIHARNAADRSDCETTEGNFPVVQDVHRDAVGEVDYLVFTTGEAGMSHAASDGLYRSWQDGTCWEMVARIGSTTYEVYEPGTIEEFTDARRESLRAQLHDIVATIRFGD